MTPITIVSSALLLLPALAAASPLAKRDSNFTTADYQNFSDNAAALNPTYAKCSTFMKSFTVTSNNTFFPIPEFACQGEVTSLFVDVVSGNSNFSTEYPTTVQEVTDSYDLYIVYCEPPAGPTKDVALQLTHGINFDHTYWMFNTTDGQTGYNFVEAATGQGYATVAYDRLGVGKSSRPSDGLNITQAATQVALANAIGLALKDGSLVDGVEAFTEVVSIGHSFGSEISTGVAGTYKDTFDAIILTGFTTSGSGVATTLAGLGITLASEVNSTKFPSSDYNYNYLAAGSDTATRQLFFYGNSFRGIGYDEEVFLKAVKGTQSFTAGEFLTLASPTLTNTAAYTGDVYVVTGSHDLIYCNGGCIVDGVSLPAQAQSLFPGAASFDTYIPAYTGHGMNSHYSAPETYLKIFAWLSAHGH